MTQNPLYTAQSTLEKSEGVVWRLPLVVVDENPAEKVPGLRNPFTTPMQEMEDRRRLEEGKMIVKALRVARNQANEHGDPLPWSEVMLLVRRRTHLTAYETALREAGIPFVSSRRGGLLESLEVTDVIALLRFLITPGDNQALAHVLKSPVFSVTDEDLIVLAQRREASWWKRLLALEPKNDVLQRAASLLTGWMDVAHFLPVHDLLDRILHQGELVQRYAQHAAQASRSQVVGNLAAFTELALNMDAGRYPGLPKFIAALSEYQSGGAGDAPDESQIEHNADAVRILTIHSAKGLEARVVVLADANHSEASKESLGILCDWPLEEVGSQQKHFSVFGRKNQRGAARDGLFHQEDQLAAQENWNLLYVAATRAKQCLIISGVDGAQTDSWYERMQAVDEFAVHDASAQTIPQAKLNSYLSITTFVPPDLALPTIELNTNVTNSEAQQEGVALHSLMERLTNLTSGSTWPVFIPDAQTIAQWLPCSLSLAQVIRTQAQAILYNVKLERFFNPAHFRFARNEMEIVVQDNGHGENATSMQKCAMTARVPNLSPASGREGRSEPLRDFHVKRLRLDRMVVFDDAVWVLDYKRQLLAMERADYQTQLDEYAAALRQIVNQEKIFLGLILADGNLVELTASKSHHE